MRNRNLSKLFRPSHSWFGFTVLFVLCALFGPPAGAQTAWPQKSAPGAAKTAAPDPVLIDLTGYNQILAKYRGKPLVVNFWATWCEPCREEYPMLVDLAKQFAPQGVVVVGVSMDDDSDMNLVRRFLVRNHPGFPNYRQKPGIDLDAFYPAVNPEWHGSMPETVFYAADGRILGSFVGSRPREVFEQAIRAILATGTNAGKSPSTGASNK
jgi:thiol-disulfide isomerase/thioredoxin